MQNNHFDRGYDKQIDLERAGKTVRQTETERDLPMPANGKYATTARRTVRDSAELWSGRANSETDRDRIES